MRRKTKYMVYGVLIGTGVASLIDIIVQWLEKRESGERLTWDNYDGKRTLK